MVLRKPLIQLDGELQELPAGDFLNGVPAPAPDFVPGSYPVGWLASSAGRTYRSKGIVYATAAPGSYANWAQFWELLGYDDSALQVQLAGKQSLLTAGSIAESLLSQAVQQKLNSFSIAAVFALLEAGPGITIRLDEQTGKILISTTTGPAPSAESASIDTVSVTTTGPAPTAESASIDTVIVTTTGPASTAESASIDTVSVTTTSPAPTAESATIDTVTIQ